MSFSSAKDFSFFFWEVDILYHLPVPHKIRLWLEAVQWNLYKQKYPGQVEDLKKKSLQRQLEDTQGKLILWGLGVFVLNFHCFRSHMAYETSFDSSPVPSKDRLLISSVLVLRYHSFFKADVFLHLCFVRFWGGQI